MNEMVIQFELCLYPASKWNHQSHIIMALWYLHKLPLDVAKTKIKNGIKAYNISQGGKNTAEEGYHETITEFYIRVLSHVFSHSQHKKNCEAIVAEVMTSEIALRDFALQFYSRSLLFSKKARLNWVEPDIRPISVPEKMFPV